MKRFSSFAWITALLVIVALSPLPEVRAKSIHQNELEHWRSREAAGWQAHRDPQDLPVAALGEATAILGHEVHGYHPYWQGEAYLDYDWSLISTVAFFALELDTWGQVSAAHGWPWTGLVTAAHAGGARAIVTAALYGSSSVGTLLSDASRRSMAVNSIVAAVQAGGADGASLDFEFVPSGQGGNFVLFVAELQDSLAAVLAEPYLSVATPAVDWTGSYTYAQLADHCDHLMIMAYSYRWSGSETTGPVSPLTGWGTYNVTWTVADYLGWGVAPEKLLLGVPYYGIHWPASGPEPGDDTTGDGSALTYAVAYPEGLEHGLIRDDEGQTVWYRYFESEWQQVWFDDAISLGAKYEYLKDQQLAGVGIWALGYDGARQELWTALADAFEGDTAVPEGVGLLGQAQLSAPWPNPGGTDTRWRLSLAAPAHVRVSIHDIAGRHMATFLDASLPVGERTLRWDGRDAAGRALPTGVYLARVLAGEERVMGKLILLRK